MLLWLDFQSAIDYTLSISLERSINQVSPRKKEEWITGQEAAIILTEKSGHQIQAGYVRFLAYRAGKIKHRPRDGRTEEYLKSDVEAYRVRKHKKQTTDQKLPAVA